MAREFDLDALLALARTALPNRASCSVADFARALNLPASTIHTYVRDGRLPAIALPPAVTGGDDSKRRIRHLIPLNSAVEAA